MAKEIWQRFKRTNTPGLLEGIRVIINTDQYAASSPRVDVLRDFVEEMYKAEDMRNHLPALEMLVKILKRREGDAELSIRVKSETKMEKINLPMHEKSHNGVESGKTIKLDDYEPGEEVISETFELTVNISLKGFF